MAFASLTFVSGKSSAESVKIEITGGSNAIARGVYVTRDFWFELSEDWAFPENSILELKFSHTPIVVKQKSTLTVLINESPVETIYLDASNIQKGTLTVSVPGRLLKGGMNVLQIATKMRTDIEDLCEDVHNPGLWMLVERESFMQINYKEMEIVPDLKGFPAGYANPDLLYQKEEENRINTVIVVTDEPSQAELEAAGALAVVFGEHIGLGKGQFIVVPSSQLSVSQLQNRHVVLVGTLEHLSRFTGGNWNVPLPSTMIQSSGEGYLMEFPSPFSKFRRLLVMTGRDDKALKLVSDNIRNPATLKNLKGPAVAFERPPVFEVSSDVRTDAVFMVRLKDLKMTDLSARGKFYHSLTFTMPNPYVGKVRDGAFIRLSMSHSELVLPESSSLLVKVNGEPVRSVRLTKESAPRNTWDVRLPLEYLNSRFLTFELEIFMDIGDPDCFYNHPEMAWFTLHNETLLYLPIDSAQSDTLANFPYMFLLWNRFDNLASILVDPISEASLSASFNTTAFLSQSLRSPNWVDVMVAKSDSVTDEQFAGMNFLVFGTIEKLKADKRWASLLPVELAGGEADEAHPAIDSGLLSSAGFLSIVKNPANPRRRILFVTGAGDAEIERAAAFLFKTGSVEWVRGELAAVTTENELKILLPLSENEPAKGFDPAAVRYEDKEGMVKPVLDVEEPSVVQSRHNVAYLVFFFMTPVLVLLVILRLRRLSRDGKGKAGNQG